MCGETAWENFHVTEQGRVVLLYRMRKKFHTLAMG
jgi:hypothetical protein